MGLLAHLVERDRDHRRPDLALLPARLSYDILGTLPVDQRSALALAYFGGYTQREIAALTGVPLGTVKSRMFTGIRRLRDLLGPRFDDLDGPTAGAAR